MEEGLQHVLQPDSLPQHALTTDPPVSWLEEANTFLFHWVGKVGRERKCVMEEKICGAPRLLHGPYSCRASQADFFTTTLLWSLRCLLLQLPLSPDQLALYDMQCSPSPGSPPGNPAGTLCLSLQLSLLLHPPETTCPGDLATCTTKAENTQAGSGRLQVKM